MKVEMWSDFLCPYCLLGKKRLALAMERLGLDAGDIEIKSFLLNPRGRAHSGEPLMVHLLDKYGGDQAGMEETFRYLTDAGKELGFRLDFYKARNASTDDAHRLFQFAKARGLGAAFSDRLQRAAYEEGAVLDDRETLLDLSVETGLPREEAEAALTRQAYWDGAQAEHREAEALDVQGVPFTLINRRVAVSGAQPAATFEKALRMALEEEKLAGEGG